MLIYDAMLILAQAEEYRGVEFKKLSTEIIVKFPELKNSVDKIREVVQMNLSAVPRHPTEENIRRWQRKNGYRFIKRLQAPHAGDRYLAYVDTLYSHVGTLCVMKEMPHREHWLMGKTLMHEDRVLEQLAHLDHIPQIVQSKFEIEECEFFIKTWAHGDELLKLSHAAMVMLSKTLADIHDAGVVVVDLCPRNVLSNGKLFDFGCSQIGDVVDTFVMEPIYTAPEIYQTRQATAKSDVFALAVLWHRLKYKQHPFVLQSSKETSKRKREIACYGMSHFSAVLSRDDVPEIIRRMLRSDPTQRPTARDCYDALRTMSVSYGNSA